MQTSGNSRILVKDKLIKIFSLYQRKNLDNETITIKHYHHPQNQSLKAYVRNLSASEQFASNANKDNSTIQFTINHRNISNDMYVEFAGKTYAITAPDKYEFYNTDIKFMAKEVAPITAEETEYEVWS
ncbi:MAG: phage head closure protein [Ignavibacteria bacterium]|jgi:SPP1 family predicted phage head-tail adaptor|nr:phage head closure protein [Ignavibacteria bacterium]MCU7525856.1 phage head closure protein [Ignavibacteria bacterium]